MCNKNTPQKPCWNEMEDLKYLICAIDCCKCPEAPLVPSHSIMLPPRIQEVPCIMPPRRPVCHPPTSCSPPIATGPCCPCPLPRSPQLHVPPPAPTPTGICCPSFHPLPCYPKQNC